MSTVRQKSFTARLSYGEYAVCFYELTLKAESVSGYFRNTYRTVPGNDGYANLKDTHRLCLNNKLNADEGVLLYFRYINDRYVAYVREQGSHYGNAIGESSGWLMTASTPISFQLTTPGNQSQTLTLDDLPNASREELCIIGPRGLLQYYDFVPCDNSFSHSYLVTHGGKTTIPFMFEIVETNVPYVEHPDEV